jgi:hypothetical protein
LHSDVSFKYKFSAEAIITRSAARLGDKGKGRMSKMTSPRRGDELKAQGKQTDRTGSTSNSSPPPGENPDAGKDGNKNFK